MRRTLAILAGWAGAWAQGPALPHLDAYKAWREAEPELERDAVKGGAEFADRTSRAGSAAAKAAEARTSYWRGLSEEATRQLIAMGNQGVIGEPDLAPAAQFQQYIATETRAVANNLKSFANDRDPGIQQLRTAFERERQSLEALSQAIVDREKASEKNKGMVAATEAARTRTLEQYQSLSTAVKDALAQTDRERAGWANYYTALAGAVASAPAGPPDAPPAAITISGVRINNPAKPAIESAKQNPANSQPGPTPAPPTETRALVNPPTRPAPAAPPVLRSRYLGGWSFPVTGGQFFGPQPESASLEVREENGKVFGGLSVRFKVPAGSAGDPELRLMFSGELKEMRTQSFALETTDGAKGTIELIPGNAFNLLEINFLTEPRSGKVARGNFVLLKN